MEIVSETEKDLRIKELENLLKVEKEKSVRMENKIIELKERINDLSTQSEAEEEAITLKLTRRMNELKREKEDLMKQVDIEEDHITNTLLRKLDRLQKEKVSLEQKLEYEQECMVNRLQRQIQAIHREKTELRGRLREDTQVLLRTIQSSIELLQQARSASATPALEPHPVDVPAEMEEVSKRLRSIAPPSPVLVPGTPTSSSHSLVSQSPQLGPQYMQEAVIEGEKKMKELIQVVNGMDRALSHPSDPYELIPPQPMILGGVVLDDANIRLRTGSIASTRSRSNSIIGNRDRSRHASISE